MLGTRHSGHYMEHQSITEGGIAADEAPLHNHITSRKRPRTASAYTSGKT